MNKVYKVVKGRVCHEFAKGAKKGAVGFTTLALAIIAANAHAADTPHPTPTHPRATTITKRTPHPPAFFQAEDGIRD